MIVRNAGEGCSLKSKLIEEVYVTNLMVFITLRNVYLHFYIFECFPWKYGRAKISHSLLSQICIIHFVIWIMYFWGTRPVFISQINLIQIWHRAHLTIVKTTVVPLHVQNVVVIWLPETELQNFHRILITLENLTTKECLVIGNAN